MIARKIENWISNSDSKKWFQLVLSIKRIFFSLINFVDDVQQQKKKVNAYRQKNLLGTHNNQTNNFDQLFSILSIYFHNFFSSLSKFEILALINWDWGAQSMANFSFTFERKTLFFPIAGKKLFEIHKSIAHKKLLKICEYIWLLFFSSLKTRFAVHLLFVRHFQ